MKISYAAALKLLSAQKKQEHYIKAKNDAPINSTIRTKISNIYNGENKLCR